MIQRARRSLTAPPCTCGLQPMHVHHLAGNRHSLECPPCGIATQAFGSEALAQMSWRNAVQGVEQPIALRPVPVNDHPGTASRFASRG
mgnify:CR=1 FL=1